MKIINIAGARPNFMKISPLQRAMDEYNKKVGEKFFNYLLVHTGQHYDYEMSKIFFQELKIPEPDIYLGIGSCGHGEQTGKIMIELESVLIKEKPDLVIVVGDVNSTLAGALVAVKLYIPVAHIEAGLRSYDRGMPEEINRLLTDAISDILFTPSPDADENLQKEGVPKEKIFLVGDIMIDNLVQNIPLAKNSKILDILGVENSEYCLLTLHRPSNVDNYESFLKILKALKIIGEKIPVIFPCHPRTRKQIDDMNLSKHFIFLNNQDKVKKGINVTPPFGYLDFLNLMMNSCFVLTDSGGIQEETTFLNIPCITLRDTTERPITISSGTNVLVGSDAEKIIAESLKILSGKAKTSSVLDVWDGKTAPRIVKVLSEKYIN